MDTTVEAHRLQATIYRRMAGVERLAIAFDLTETVREIALSGIRQRHPEYPDATVTRAYARLVLGDERCREIWPGEPLVEP